MFIYVLNQDGKPLMPTKRFGKVRRLLRDGKAKVIDKNPFTIQLVYETGNVIQDISLGVDSGSKTVGLSATTSNQVLFEAEVKLRNDIVEKLSTRREVRRGRRNRKTRYRKARFNNRKRCEKWLAPSIRHKIETHLSVIDKIYNILPISKLVVETASFDIQKIKNPDIHNEMYQKGEQLGFWNVREYVLFRDGHTCQCCKGKSKDKILNVHHIKSRKTGGDAPNNLITLCETCHKGYHNGTVELPSRIKRGMSFRDAAFMGIMRWALYNELKSRYKNVSMTFGYITKSSRTLHGLPKEHYIDARCISGNALAKDDDCIYYYRKVRRHNRQIHRFNILKGGVKKRNQTDYDIHGFHLYDRVMYQGKQYFIFGRRKTGYFDIRTLSGDKVNNGSVSYKKLKLLEHVNGYLIERRSCFSLMTKVASIQTA